MTDDNYHPDGTASRTLYDIYRRVCSIDVKVGDILDEIQDGLRTRSEGNGYDFEDIFDLYDGHE